MNSVMFERRGSCDLFSPVSVEEWSKVHSTNALGTMLCYKHAAIQMMKQGRGGRIIGASSIAGKKGMLIARYMRHNTSLILCPCAVGIAGNSRYAATKFGVRGLTQSAGEY